MNNGILKRLHGSIKEYGILLALLVIVLLFNFLTSGTLLAPDNVASLIQQNGYVIILAIGMTMVIIARHIDLSVGSIVAFVGGVVAIAMNDFHLNWLVACLLGLVLGVVIGCWQGFWVAYVGVPAFIVTLGGMLIFRGLAIVIVGQTVSGLPNGFNAIASGSVPNFLGFVGQIDAVTMLIGVFAVAGVLVSTVKKIFKDKKAGLVGEPLSMVILKTTLISVAILYFAYLLSLSSGGTPYLLIIMGILIVIYSFIMAKTRFGRHIYAVGGNLRAAELSGINTKKVDFLVFVNMGLLSGLAAIVTTARAGAAVATAGNMYELDAIAAAFIGGTAVSGGVGKISGAIIGALIMGVLNMGLSILSVDAAWQQAIKGLVVMIAVAADLISSRRAGR